MLKNHKVYAKEWAEIQKLRLDLEKREIEFFGNLRAEFPGGQRGDHQFSEYVVTYLGIKRGGPLEAALRRAKAKTKLGAEVLSRVKDTNAAVALMNFPTVERNKILAKIEKPEGVSADDVRHTGLSLGFRSRYRAGRSMNLDIRIQRDRLRDWVRHLYAVYDLPELPDNVKAALGAKVGAV